MRMLVTSFTSQTQTIIESVQDVRGQEHSWNSISVCIDSVLPHEKINIIRVALITHYIFSLRHLIL